ncbi:MAG: 5-carboxymethyl-2-hydroxymuconate Delta-isomerase [Pseudomonadota bacterium]
MPHIIVEYTEQLADDEQIAALLQSVHSAIAESGLFESSHIKTRAYPFRHFTQAGGHEPYIHVQARIKSGRNTENKKRLSAAILDAIRRLNIPPAVITVEIIDMDRDSYAKHAPKG